MDGSSMGRDIAQAMGCMVVFLLVAGMAIGAAAGAAVAFFVMR